VNDRQRRSLTADCIQSDRRLVRPEELAEQFRVGVPEARLLARHDGPPAPIPREPGISAPP